MVYRFSEMSRRFSEMNNFYGIYKNRVPTQSVPYFIDSGYLLVPCRMVINELYILEISKSDDQDNLTTGNMTTDIFPMYRENMKLKESLPDLRQDYAHGSNFEIIYKFKSIDNAM